MRALLQQLGQVSVPVFLVSSMLATGLMLSPRMIAGPLRDPGLVLRAVGLNFLFAPGFAWLLTRVIPLGRDHAVGLLLLSCAAGAPFLPNLLRAARADQALGAAVMTLLTLGTIIFLPLAQPFIAPELGSGPWSIARPLLLLIVAPLVVGTLVHSSAPRIAAWAAPVFSKLGSASLLLFSVLLIGLNGSAMLAVVGSGAILAALVFFAGLFGLGWMSAGSRSGEGAVLGLGTTARNFGAALVPAASGSSEPGITVMIIIGAVVCLTVSFSAAGWVRGRAALVSV